MKLKKAFSLIEVLLVMGIIAVVTAMGFSISKNGMEKAYNQYWFTGYDALRRATVDATYHEFDPENANLDTYATHLAKLMNTEVSVNGLSRKIIAPNGIEYNIKSVGNDKYQIDMTIPKLNQRKAFANKTRFFYMFNNDAFPFANEKMLYPSSYSADNYINLQDRVDLLTYYLTDGTNTNTKTFYSFREAFCNSYQHTSVQQHDAEGNPVLDENGEPVYEDFDGYNDVTPGASISCSGITRNPDLEGSTIIPINPRKAF